MRTSSATSPRPVRNPPRACSPKQRPRLPCSGNSPTHRQSRAGTHPQRAVAGLVVVDHEADSFSSKPAPQRHERDDGPTPTTPLPSTVSGPSGAAAQPPTEQWLTHPRNSGLQQALYAADQGFETELGPDGGGLTVELADGQAEAYYLADYICSARFPLHAAYTRALTETQLRVYYDWNRVEVASCMTSRGYQPSEPSSFPVYVETYRSGRGLWTPFDAVADPQFTETMADLSAHCTLEPPDEEVFGDLG